MLASSFGGGLGLLGRPMTLEILNFLRNEARLQAQKLSPNLAWEVARRWVRIAEEIVDAAVRDGLPAHGAPLI